MVSRQSKAALNVITESKSRLTRITRMNKKTAACTDKAITKALAQYPAYARKTITYDNGSENLLHTNTNEALGTSSYFCNPYHSWEKGTDDNRIGVLRWGWSKNTDFAKLSDEEIGGMENWINSRPMKCLDYDTPYEAFVALNG